MEIVAIIGPLSFISFFSYLFTFPLSLFISYLIYFFPLSFFSFLSHLFLSSLIYLLSPPLPFTLSHFSLPFPFSIPPPFPLSPHTLYIYIYIYRRPISTPTETLPLPTPWDTGCDYTNNSLTELWRGGTFVQVCL